MSDIPKLEEQLAAPLLAARLDALRQLAKTVKLPARTGTNTHVHTNYSFGVFRSPSEAAWHGAKAGVEVLGINDFFTTAGYGEFAQACAILKLPATYSIECIAVDRALAAGNVLLNDPGNPGRIYLCGKGVTRPTDPRAAKTLGNVRNYQENRNRSLCQRLDGHFQTTLKVPGPTWNDIVAQTPEGNTTERHVARACLRRLQNLAHNSSGTFADLFLKLVGVAPKDGDAEPQNQIRGGLLKAGKPCYSPEDPAAFPDVAGLRQVMVQLGAIPVYPVLGDPVTDGEKDIPALFDRLAEWGFCAIELIPARNTDDRVAAVLAEAGKRHWPVCDGTEHNTPVMEPLTTKWGLDERFRGQFRDGALVLLGHQRLRALNQPGYVDDAGVRLADGFERCLDEGHKAMA